MYQWRSHTHTHSPSRSDDSVARFSALKLLCHQPVNQACLLTWNIGDKKMRGRAMRKECHTYSTHTQNTPHHISAGPQPTTSKHIHCERLKQTRTAADACTHIHTCIHLLVMWDRSNSSNPFFQLKLEPRADRATVILGNSRAGK